MRKIHKFFVTLGLSATLFFAFEQEEAKANFPTIDISNLLQNILGFIQDAESTGLFSRFSSIAMQTEEYTEKIEKFKKFLSTMNTIRQGIKYTRDIVRITTSAVNQLMYQKNCIDWFNSQGAMPSVMDAALKCQGDFQSFFEGLTEDSQTKTDFINSLSSGDGLQILSTMDAMLKTYEKEFYQAAWHFNGEMSQAYMRHCRLKMAVSDMAFLNKAIYY